MKVAGVDMGGVQLVPDRRRQNTSVGVAASGTLKFTKFRASDRIVSLRFVNKSTTLKDSLGAALEADADYSVTLDPDTDTHIDLGGGAGVSITAKWIDGEFNATPVTFNSWTIEANFIKV